MRDSVEQLAERFEKEGVLVLRKIYSPGLISKLLMDLDGVEKSGEFGSGDSGGFVTERVGSESRIKYVQGVNHSIRDFNQLQSLQVLDLASRLLDDQVYFAEMELHDKAANGGTETPPHQDNFYFCFDPPKALTVYVPLEKHGPENGIPGGIPFGRTDEAQPFQSARIF